MPFHKATAATLALTAGLFLSAVAQAHPRLLSSTPAEGADGVAPSSIALHFPSNLRLSSRGRN